MINLKYAKKMTGVPHDRHGINHVKETKTRKTKQRKRRLWLYNK